MVSRSFGQEVTDFDDLSESVAYFATTAAEKLRKDGSVAANVCVFIQTNPFKEKSPQYQRSLVVPMGEPTCDTVKLVNAAMRGLKAIYRVGYSYKKSGVILMGLQPGVVRRNPRKFCHRMIVRFADVKHMFYVRSAETVATIRATPEMLYGK